MMAVFIYISKKKLMETRQFRITNDLLATQGQRLGNYLIDLIIQYLIAGALGVLIALIANLTDNLSLATWLESTSTLEEYLVGLLILILYYNLTEIFLSRTIAKYITKTIVVTENGTKPSSESIIKRTFCRIIPFNHLSFLGTPSRGWHDSLSQTYVVKKEPLEEKMNLFYAFDEIGKEVEI